jgi:hypothetical protein
MLDYKPRWQASKRIKFRMVCGTILRLPPHICSRTTQCRASAPTMHEGSAAQQIYQVSPTTRLGAKKGIGKTGVHLRYHPNSEYQKLTTEQKDALREWPETSGGGKKRGNHNAQAGKQQRNVRCKTDKSFAAVVEKKVHERYKTVEQETAKGLEDEAYIISIFQKLTGSKASVGAVNLSLPPTLHIIIRRAKNAKTD